MAFEDKKWRRRSRSTVPPQYRRKRRWIKILAITASVILLCLVALLLLPKILENNSSLQATDTTSPPDTVVHFVAGGDVNVTDKTVASGLQEGGYHYTHVFKDVLPVLSRGDITALNYEGILGKNTYGTATKAAPPEMLQALTAAGVDVLQTANSYSVYDSIRGLTETLQGIQETGLTPLGTYASNADFNQSGGYIIWEVQGIKIAMMAFTKGFTNSAGLPQHYENCVNLLYQDYNSTYQKVDKEGITQIVHNAAQHGPDVMIALVHWGSEGADQISKSQNQIVSILQQEGVDAIIGTHSHKLQKMDFDPETGMFVAYSLGDFLSDGGSYSVILDLEITKSGSTGETKISNYSFVPIYVEAKEETVRILRIKEALEGYENQYLDRVSPETYSSMKSAWSKIQTLLRPSS